MTMKHDLNKDTLTNLHSGGLVQSSGIDNEVEKNDLDSRVEFIKWEDRGNLKWKGGTRWDGFVLDPKMRETKRVVDLTTIDLK